MHCAGVRASTRVAAAQTAATQTICTARTRPSKKTSWASTERLVFFPLLWQISYVFTFSHVQLVIANNNYLSQPHIFYLSQQKDQTLMSSLIFVARQNNARIWDTRTEQQCLIRYQPLMDAFASISSWRGLYVVFLQMKRGKSSTGLIAALNSICQPKWACSSVNWC